MFARFRGGDGLDTVKGMGLQMLSVCPKSKRTFSRISRPNKEVTDVSTPVSTTAVRPASRTKSLRGIKS